MGEPVRNLASKLTAALEEVAQSAPAGWLAALRKRGADQFRLTGLPAKQVEQWKYTSLYQLEQLQPSLGTAGPVKEPSLAVEPLANLSLRVSMVDGEMAAIHGDPAPGVNVMSLQSALAAENKMLRSVLDSLEMDQKGQGFSALNTASLGPGLVIQVAEGIDAGELLVQWCDGPDQGDSPVNSTLFNSRVVVVLEESAKLHLVEQYENDPGRASILNIVTQHSLARHSELTLTRVQQLSAASFLMTRSDVSQAADSRFHFTGIDLGTGLARHDVKASLEGSGASCILNGACMGSGQSHADHHLDVAHVAPNCQSSQLFRAVANDRSRVVFNGKVHVHKGADGTDAKQSSAGLLLSKLAEIDAKPELEIYADEVIASHGATVGQLDEEAMFYLRSRGLGTDEARNLLTMAFCRSVTDQLPVEVLREPLGERLTQSLIRDGATSA